jgi:small-conductance mechanosensitive channel
MTVGSAVDTLDGARLNRRAKRFAVLAVVACPCHLPLVATVLALVGFGGTAAALRDNLILVSVIFASMTVVAVALAIRSSRAATACRLSLPPPPQRVPTPDP